MNIGVFSGINGDVEQASRDIDRFKRLSVDLAVCLGDLLGNDPDPELISAIKAQNILLVLGANEQALQEASSTLVRVPSQVRLSNGFAFSGYLHTNNAFSALATPDPVMNIAYVPSHRAVTIDGHPQIVSGRHPYNPVLFDLTGVAAVELPSGQRALFDDKVLRLLEDVLVVEDNSRYVRGLRSLLGEQDITVKAVATYDEGLDVAVNELPSVMLVDGNLPDGRHGLDLVRAVRSIGLPIRIIAAYGDQNVTDKDWIDAGADTCFRKTGKGTEYAREDLAETADHYLKGSS